MISEQEYLSSTGMEHRKKFAQFFTPEPIARFMSQWIIEDFGLSDKPEILEPAIGLGIFTRFLYQANKHIVVKGYDVDKQIYDVAQSNFSNSGINITLENTDYISSSFTDCFDGIICNPPYLNFHDYNNTQLIPLINNKLNVNLNGLTNIYALFLLKSINQLKDGGKLAYIVPSEFLNADYGVEVKKQLLNSGVLRHIIIIDYNQCAFNDALTTACILLCQKTANSSVNIRFSKITDITNLTSALSEYKTYNIKELKPEWKWKKYYESTNSSSYNHLVPFSTFAKVTRGIATGDNNFFTFNLSKKDDTNLPDECLLPCICHSIDVKTLIFTADDFTNLSVSDKKAYLFNGVKNEHDTNVREYILIGEKAGINKKHLTSRRTPWYAIENRKPSPIWVSVFNREGLKFVQNKANVLNLTTFHCVYNSGKIDTDILFAYLITDVAKEIFSDNSRQYGNGLVKFEPNDLNKGNVVDLRILTKDELQFVRDLYMYLGKYGSIYCKSKELLNDFFRKKFTNQTYNSTYIKNALKEFGNIYESDKSNSVKHWDKQLNFFDLLSQNTYGISSDNEAGFNGKKYSNRNIETDRNCLICSINSIDAEKYEQQIANTYYADYSISETVQMDKLFYFIPFIPSKGIRDLYLITTVQLENSKKKNIKRQRMVFNITFVKQLYKDYSNKKIITHNKFIETTINKIINS